MTESEFGLDLVSRPLARRPDALHALCSCLRVTDQLRPTNAVDAGSFAARPRGPRGGDAFAGAVRGADGVAVLPLFGVLAKRAPTWLWPYATNTLAFSNILRESLADSAIRSIVLEIDSPGGAVDAGQELADIVFAARGQKPIYAVANSAAASAAYWIGSQADRLFITPGGQVGSIGVYAAHEDISKAMDAAGLKVSLIAAGKYKTEQSPFAPLSSDARGHLQSQVDDAYQHFVTAVARGRDVSPDFVRKSMGGGRMLGAGRALGARMVDGIATLEQVARRAAAIRGTAKVESLRAQMDRIERMQCATPKVAAMREDLERSIQSRSATHKSVLH